MYILGLSFDYHDSAAALLRDGFVVAAAQEERFSRIKNDPSFPASAISFCLEKAGISSEQLDHIVFYEKPLLKFDRILKASIQKFPDSKNYFKTTLKSWLLKKKFTVDFRISKFLNVPISKVHFVKHHDSHAASAFFPSPFNDATIVTLDGVGEYETVTVSVGKGNTIQRVYAIGLPHSLGLFYSAFTAFLGFKVNEDEYKVMGMAGFGEPKYYKQLIDCFNFFDDGIFSLRQEYFNFLHSETVPYTKALVDMFGLPREPESQFRINNSGSSEDIDQVVVRSQHYADIAASVQKCTEEVILHIVSNAIKRCGSRNVCLAGGVALNSLANGRLQRELGCNLYVHPAAGDAGGALGAALYYNYCVLKESKRTPLESVFLGKDYQDKDINEAIKRSYTKKYQTFSGEKSLLDTVAKILNDGAVVGWMQGRFEWGPRALGARSILANPALPNMQRIVNEKIKFREPFRPFAPAVLEDRARDFFDIMGDRDATSPENFMLTICNVRKDKTHLLPAVTHVDGTARVQIVSRKTNQIFYDLIAAFENYSGIPVVLNTSFNLRGEPICNKPLDCIKTFEWSDIDYLVMGKYLIKKEL